MTVAAGSEETVDCPTLRAATLLITAENLLGVIMLCSVFFIRDRALFLIAVSWLQSSRLTD